MNFTSAEIYSQTPVLRLCLTLHVFWDIDIASGEPSYRYALTLTIAWIEKNTFIIKCEKTLLSIPKL